MNPLPGSLAIHQFLENRQDLLAVAVHLPKLLAHSYFIPVPPQEFLEKLLGNVDIPAQSFCRVPAQKQAIKKGRFPLGR
jgi:hypothetical protein